MSLYEYEALTSSGRMMKGTLEAASSQQARQMLGEMQLTVSVLQDAPSHGPSRGIGRSEFILFNQQLASITQAGIPLEGGLRQLAKDIQSAPMRRLVMSLADDLAAGTTLEAAFDKRKKFFPPLYGLIVKAGVQSGRLAEMLTSLNRHLEVSTLTRRIVFDAMAYPAVVLLLAAVIMTGVICLVIPSFREIFAGMGVQLPMITELVMELPYVVPWIWAGLGVLVAAALLVGVGSRGSWSMLWLKEAMILRLPILGRLHHRALLSRLTDAMALLVAAGIDMPTTLRLAAGATGCPQMTIECEAVAQAVERGEGIFQAGQACRIVPPLVFYSMQLGGQRGELQDNLYGLADMYGQQVRVAQTRLQAMLVPLMILVVGGMIATMIVALFMPMVAMINAVQKQ